MDDRESIVDECLARCVAAFDPARGRFSTLATFAARAYFYRSGAHYRCPDVRALREWRFADYGGTDHEFMPDEPTVEPHDPYADTVSDILDACPSLTDRERMICVLHFGGGWKLAEIATTLGLTKERVRQVLSLSALPKLRRAHQAVWYARKKAKKNSKIPS